MHNTAPPPRASDLDSLLGILWQDYIRMNPDARRIHELFTSRGERVVNDHIALRTFGLPVVSIEALASPFLQAGYAPRGSYEFPGKKLVARHYEHAEPGRPKIFISEIVVDALSHKAQAIIRNLVDCIEPSFPRRFDFCTMGRPWPIAFQDYETLRQESEYAAWVAAFGYRPNHFTIDVGALRTLGSLEQVNELLEQSGFVLNASGGKIKGTPAELLEQSSILANEIDVEFSDGSRKIPGCYYEFARRYPGPDGRPYQGFIAASADRIFESTDTRG
ncbi:MAG TPA: DUF1338 domain-containing protein [Polyangiaceae bacterium]|nr:DUF1338 domain-containing protein [Polyangiaceae bacterium]